MMVHFKLARIPIRIISGLRRLSFLTSVRSVYLEQLRKAG